MEQLRQDCHVRGACTWWEPEVAKEGRKGWNQTVGNGDHRRGTRLPLFFHTMYIA